MLIINSPKKCHKNIKSYYLFVHVLVNQKEFQILDRRDGKIKGRAYFQIYILHFRTRRRASPKVQRKFELGEERARKSKGIPYSIIFLIAYNFFKNRHVFFNETQLKLKLFLTSFINFLAHLYDRNIHKAITN